MMSAEDQQPEIKSTRNKPGIKHVMLIPASQVGYLKLVFCFDILHFLTLKQGNKLVNEIHYELYRSTATKDRKLSPYQLRNDPSTQQTPRQGCGGKPCSSQDCSGRKYLQTLSSSNVQVVKTEEQSVQGSIRETKGEVYFLQTKQPFTPPIQMHFSLPSPTQASWYSRSGGRVPAWGQGRPPGPEN